MQLYSFSLHGAIVLLVVVVVVVVDSFSAYGLVPSFLYMQNTVGPEMSPVG